MESPSKMIFDTFKHEIWEELGPLDPNWFDELTLQACTKDGNICEKAPSCAANHDGTFKTPFEKSAMDSQLFSTPKIFRHSRPLWPEREDEKLIYSEQEKETLPWTSPCLFGTSKDGLSVTKSDEDLQLQGSIELIDTPNKSAVAYAQHISESLGAQLNPDISWTSSLNTPTAMPSTLILSKPEDHPVSLSAEKNIVLVRNLFPSLSNVSSDLMRPLKKSDQPTVTQAADDCHKADQGRKSTDSPPESSPDENGSDWKLTVPDAIEDGEIRRTVESVLDGAENVLSMFFSNSSSALRRVKTKDRIKRRQNISTNKNGCTSTNILTTKNVETSENIAEQRSNEEPDVKTGNTQWSPMSLSDSTLCAMDGSCRVSDSSKQLESRIVMKQPGSESGPGQVVTPSFIKSHSNKKRSFVYTVPRSSSREQGKERAAQQLGSSGQEIKEKEMKNVPDEAQYCDIRNKIYDGTNPGQNLTNKVEDNLQIPVKGQDIDMSQLCRAFAQDFSQMSDSGQVGSIDGDEYKNGFSASACLTALKHRKNSLLCRQESKVQRGTSHGLESNHIGNERDMVSDSGIQSTVAVVTQVTGSSFVLPSSEQNAESQQCRTGTEKKMHTKNTSVQLTYNSKTLIDKSNLSEQNGKVHTSIPQRLTVCPINVPGFQTASKGGIHISTANLDRAKSLFKDIEDNEPTKCSFNTGSNVGKAGESVDNISKSNYPPSSNERFGDAQCFLTASQKADVTELCCFLEEAESQFEFTQFRPVKISLHSEDNSLPPQQADKELDPDFLIGIDFDESLNSDVEKHLMTPDKMPSYPVDKNKCKEPSTTTKFNSAVKQKNVSIGDEVSISKHALEGIAGIVSANFTTDDVDMDGNGLGAQRVSKNCLQKAKALFAHLEENPVIIPDPGVCSDIVSANCEHPQPSPDKLREDFAVNTKHQDTSQNSDLYYEEDIVSTSDICTGERNEVRFSNVSESQFQTSSRQMASIQVDKRIERNKQLENVKISTAAFEKFRCIQKSGFQMASGKDIKISAKAIQDANAFFKDCDVIESKDLGSTKHMKELTKSVTASGVYEDGNSSFKSAQVTRDILGKPIDGCFEIKTVDIGPAANDTILRHEKELLKNDGPKNPADVIRAGSSPGNPSLIVSVCDRLLIKAPSLFQECDQFEDQKHHTEAKRTSHFTRPLPPRNCGFQTASGKGVTISTRALKKAKAMLNECDKDQDKKTIIPNNIPADKPPLRNCGFHTASGKGLAISTAALHKAKSMFSECEEFENIKKNTEDRIITSELADNGCVNTANGKSNSAVTKAKCILQEADSFEDQTLKSDPMGTSNFTRRIQAQTPRNCGFQTASGKGVTVSTTALQKAKAMLSEYNQMEEEKKENTKVNTGIKHVPVNIAVDPLPRNGGFQTASGKGVIISTSALQKAKALLSECDEDQDMKMRPSNIPTDEPPPMNCTKALLSECAEVENIKKNTEDKIITSVLASNGGVGTVSRKKGYVSSNALTKQKSCLHECDQFEDQNQTSDAQRTRPIQAPPLRNGGFQTASGKGVAISTRALQKAKAMLSEDRKENTETGIKTVQAVSMDHPAPHKDGFQTASGKGVVISSIAIQRAKTLFNEFEEIEHEKEIISINPKIQTHNLSPRNDGSFIASGKQLNSAEANFLNDGSSKIAAISQTKKTGVNHDDVQNNREQINRGFTTARGVKVHVSETDLLKARNLLNDPANVDVLEAAEIKSCVTQNNKTDHVKKACRDPGMSSVPCSKGPVAFKKPSTCNKAPVTPSEDYLHDVNHDGQEEIKHHTSFASFTHERRMKIKDGTVEDCEMVTHPSPSARGSPVLNFGSLGLSGCTITQQRYFAQEAIDCAKALLEDEEVADQDLTKIQKKIPGQECSEGPALERQSGKAKRLSEDINGHPPLKRRLLAEFDRTVDGPKVSALYPAKSGPDGETKDRRVFKYTTPLHPRITTPYRDSKSSADSRLHMPETQPTKPSSIPGDIKPSNFKMALFVPPFHKNVRTGSQVPQGKTKTSAVFVPPFKKVRTSVQDSSPKLNNEDGTPNTNVFVPPAKKSHIPTKVTENESEEAIPTVVSEEVKNESEEAIPTVVSEEVETADGLQSAQSLPFNHEIKEVAAEESVSKDIISGNQDIAQSLQSLQLARDMQDMRIRKKKRQNIRPIPGSLFLAKTSGVDRIRLRDAVNGWAPTKHTTQQLYVCGVHRHVSEITSENAEPFRFHFRQFFQQQVFIDGGGVQLADGGWLIPRNDGTTGKEEFYKALCDTPGVDPKLIREEWVYNHYRWIVWKQASMERSFPRTMGSLCLTPEQVLLQLKYRYDVEVDHSRRSALRKIMERDDASAKTLVLCVCGVVSRGQDPTRQSRNDINVPQGAESKVESPVAIVWLTDGWYSIKVQMDVPLTVMLHKGQLVIGGKLIIHGAELVGSQDACSPLEAPDSLMMKICANSCRPARWDTKLGFHRDPRPFLLPISSLYSNGGPVGCVDIVVLRSYPTLWMEKKPDGGFVFRSDRAEEKEARRFNSSQHKAMEILFAKIQAEFESEENASGRSCGRRRRKTLSHQDIKSLQDGEELHEAVENDPVYLEGNLAEQQLEALNAYRRTLAEKKQSELQERYRRALEDAQEGQGGCPKRDVTPVWKLCIADSRDQLGSNVYLLNIWRPPLDLQSLLKEGGRYRVYNLTTSDGKKRPGCAAVQLTATKKTQFQDIQVSQEWLSAHFRPRTSVNFLDLQKTEFYPLCGEVDLIGYVICITDGQSLSPVIYVVDGQLNIMKVRCSSSLVQSGLEDLVKPLALLALSNLQLKLQPSAPIPVLYAADQALFSTNPRESHLQEALAQLRNLVQGQEDFFKNAEEKLSHFIQFDGLSSISSPALQPRTPGYKIDARPETRTCVRSQRPSRSFGSFTPLGRTPTLAKSSADKDPKSLKRKRALDYLSHIPSPPLLCPVGTMTSPCVNKTFNPPRRSETPSTLKTVKTPARNSVIPPAEDECVKDEELAMIDTQALHSGRS